MIQKAIDITQQRVNGQVRLALYKGNVIVIGRKSSNSLYDEDLATFETSNYDQRDAEGFIKLNALRLKKNKVKY
jgi:argininosuccinate synthase